MEAQEYYDALSVAVSSIPDAVKIATSYSLCIYPHEREDGTWSLYKDDSCVFTHTIVYEMCLAFINELKDDNNDYREAVKLAFWNNLIKLTKNKKLT